MSRRRSSGPAGGSRTGRSRLSGADQLNQRELETIWQDRMTIDAASLAEGRVPAAPPNRPSPAAALPIPDLAAYPRLAALTQSNPFAEGLRNFLPTAGIERAISAATQLVGSRAARETLETLRALREVQTTLPEQQAALVGSLLAAASRGPMGPLSVAVGVANVVMEVDRQHPNSLQQQVFGAISPAALTPARLAQAEAFVQRHGFGFNPADLPS